MSAGDQALYGGVHFAVLVQGGLQEVIVEVHRERLQVQVLLAPQVGHCKAADVIQVVRVGRAAHVLVGRIDPVAAQVGFGDILNIVSAVAVRRPAGVIRAQALTAGLHRQGQVTDLLARVVVIELAADIPAGGLQQATDTIADRRPPAVAHVQRAGGVGGHVFHLYFASRPGIAGSEGFALRQDAFYHCQVAGAGEEKIDKTRPRDLGAGDKLGRRQGLADQDGQVTGLTTRRPGQAQRNVARQVTMARVAGSVNLNLGGDIPGQMTLDHQCVQRLQDELGKLFLHCEGVHLSFFVGLPGSGARRAIILIWAGRG